jgi:four helix bundle protein
MGLTAAKPFYAVGSGLSRWTMRNFKEYEVWKSAVGLSKDVYSLTTVFPEGEKYILVSQLRRAVNSISSNIADGCARSSEADFARMLEIALGSCFEVQSQLLLAVELGFLEPAQTQATNLKIEQEKRQLYTLIQRLRKK